MSHDYYVIYESPDAFADDLQLWEALSEDILGEVPKERLYRFPGGSTCTVLDAELFPEFLAAAEAMDYRCFDWTFANNDKYTKNKPSEQSMSDFLKASAKASLGITGSCKIMLLHETSAETVEMLPWLIEYLTDEGYTLSPLTYANKGYTFAK